MKNTNRAKRLERIKKHFNNVTTEEFEENIKDCGYGKIKSASNSGFKLKPIDREGEDI
jgi:hypothetical protein